MPKSAITIYSLVALFCFGAAPLFGKVGLGQVPPLIGVLIRSSAVAVGVVVAAGVSGKLGQLGSVGASSLALLAAEGLLAGLIGHFAYFTALKGGEASRVVPMISAYPLVTVLAALLLLSEKLTWPKGVGALLVVAGLVLLRR
jgi:transporter family protein